MKSHSDVTLLAPAGKRRGFFGPDGLVEMQKYVDGNHIPTGLGLRARS